MVDSPDGKAGMFIAYPTTGEQDAATNALVNHQNTCCARELPAPACTPTSPARTRGTSTFANLIGQRMPWLIGIVIALSMLLLTVVFRSVASRSRPR